MKPRTVALLGLALSLSGCYRWEVVTIASPRAAITATEPDQIRVSVGDEPLTLTLGDLSLVAGDSVRGTTNGAARTIAFQDIAVLEMRRYDALRTAVAITGPALLVLGVITVIALSRIDLSVPTGS